MKPTHLPQMCNAVVYTAKGMTAVMQIVIPLVLSKRIWLPALPWIVHSKPWASLIHFTDTKFFLG